MANHDVKNGRQRAASNSGSQERRGRTSDGDDLADATYDEADWYDDELWSAQQMHGMPAGLRAHRARQRLERHLERRRLMAEISDGLDDESESVGRRRAHRRHRDRRNPQP